MRPIAGGLPRNLESASFLAGPANPEDNASVRLSRRSLRVFKRARRAPSLLALVTLALAAGVWLRGPRATARPASEVPARPASEVPARPASEALADPPKEIAPCDHSRALKLHFYDVGQALAVLVDLPDGRHVLVDTGDSPHRRGCGDECATKDAHLLASLRNDLHGGPIDLLWITHQHSDHIGGAPSVLSDFRVNAYVDNGRDGRKAEVKRTHDAAEEHGVSRYVVDPETRAVPLAPSPGLKLTSAVPSAWPDVCTRDENECSIGLRIDFCSSSVLFTGDAEHEEERSLELGGPVTLLQIAHHGSETSTTLAFLAKARPKYAVVSAGKPGEGLNAEYCHPRSLTIERLGHWLGTTGGKTLAAFDGLRCERATASDWVAVPTSNRLWATERDGDVVLTTMGDGTFSRD